MKLFISWSGLRSKAVAIALRRWIPDVIQTVEPWMSELDIDAGSRWSRDIANELSQTNFGIICLTKTNCTAQWLLFEAGALAKTIANTYVCPYLIDLQPSEIPQGPLTQFQAKRADENESWGLVYTINKALDESALPEEKLKRTFEKWWPDLRYTLEHLPDEETGGLTRRSMEDMVEEILNLARDLTRQSKLERVADDIERLVANASVLMEFQSREYRQHQEELLEQMRSLVLTKTNITPSTSAENVRDNKNNQRSSE